MSRKIPYRIEQTKNRHSRAVYKEDTIVIRLAKNLSEAQKSEHIESLLQRMTKHVLRSKDRIAVDPFRPLLQGESSCEITFGSGEKRTIELQAGKRTSVRRTLNGWHIHVGPKMNRKALHSLLWKTVAKDAEADVIAYVQKVNKETLNVRVKNICIRYYTSQWGSCSTTGTIALNTALLFLPEHLLHYVVVHELAHRKHQNHSHHYWKCVESVLPTYQEKRKALKGFKLLPL